MTVTKYCSEHARLEMLQGNFWIGTLTGFINAEAGGLMDDKSEGVSNMNLYNPGGGSYNFSGTIGGATISNFESTGLSVIISHENRINLNVFCTSTGPYDQQTHESIRYGSAAYRANPEYTSFIELDEGAFFQAFCSLAKEAFPSRVCCWHKPVIYGERAVSLTPEQAQSAPSRQAVHDHLIEIVHVKPISFAGEREHRFAMIPEGKTPIISLIKTSDFRQRIRRNFRKAITNEGRFLP